MNGQKNVIHTDTHTQEYYSGFKKPINVNPVKFYLNKVLNYKTAKAKKSKIVKITFENSLPCPYSIFLNIKSSTL